MEWLQLHRMPLLDQIMTSISFVSSGPANMLWAALAGLFLLWRQRGREAVFLFAGTALGSSLVILLKPLFGRVRPPSPHQVASYSFPSGHILSSTVFLVLLARLAGHHRPQGKVLYCLGASFCLLLIGASRLYLRAHWLSDIVGGVVLGLGFSWGWIATIPLDRHPLTTHD